MRKVSLWVSALLATAFSQSWASDYPPIPGLPPLKPGDTLQAPLSSLTEETQRAITKLRPVPIEVILDRVPVFAASERDVFWMQALVQTGNSGSERSKQLIALAPIDALAIPRANLLFTTLDSAVKRPDAGATRAMRVIRSGDRHIGLVEWNYIAEGSGIMQISDAVNRNISGHPAVLIVAKSQSGAALWNMSWQVKGVAVELSISEPTMELGTEGLVLDIARAATAFHEKGHLQK
jgi:hypothetical protein